LINSIKPVSIKKESIVSESLFLKAKKSLLPIDVTTTEEKKIMYILFGKLFCHRVEKV